MIKAAGEEDGGVPKETEYLVAGEEARSERAACGQHDEDDQHCRHCHSSSFCRSLPGCASPVVYKNSIAADCWHLGRG
ncbi:MAG: hypothetical protein USCGTAYLOR_00467 [Chromatiales bacterium USCg_Taylor]|nr:MAG: hypothetical protein USCGTAYLOR_00467 [Chromatiales bacterium USCg_Taylor]